MPKQANDRTSAAPVADERSAKIKTLGQVKAKGFTLGRGQIVAGVPLAHAEYLAGKGLAEILEVR
ncbi:hypothetical protein [Luteolibacter marinus]|uniref:hypothetical protein n=1 Tax=Luteolibacter marinus TaxID=2776705 RepID=UPI0018665A7A|nr:hypothetical protein [Luteolibacter marinus]